MIYVEIRHTDGMGKSGLLHSIHRAEAPDPEWRKADQDLALCLSEALGATALRPAAVLADTLLLCLEDSMVEVGSSEDGILNALHAAATAYKEFLAEKDKAFMAGATLVGVSA